MGFIKFLVALIGGAIVALSIVMPIVSLTPDKDAGPYAGAALVGAFITIVSAMRADGIRGAISRTFGWLWWSAVLQVAAAFAIDLLPKPPIHVWIMRQFMVEGGWIWFAAAAVISMILAAAFGSGGAPAGRAAHRPQAPGRWNRAPQPPAAPHLAAPVSTPAAVATSAQPIVGANPIISGRRSVDVIRRG